MKLTREESDLLRKALFFKETEDYQSYTSLQKKKLTKSKKDSK